MRHRRRVVLLVIGAAALIAINAFVLTHRETSPAATIGGEPDVKDDVVSKGDGEIPNEAPEVYEDIEDPTPPAETKE